MDSSAKFIFLKDAVEDLMSKYKATMEEQEPEDPIQKKIAQFYRETLKMQKMQNVGLISTVKSLREEMDNTKLKQEVAMDVRIPPMTQKYILERLKKESTIERNVQTLNTRMEVVDKNLQLILQNQITQAELLNKLLATHSGSSSLPLDDNKKGKKEKEDQKIKEGQQIEGADQQINLEDQQIKSVKRKSSSTFDQQIPKKTKHGLEPIEERRRLREAHTRSLDEQEKKQLTDLQQKTQKIISAVKEGAGIQIEFVVDNSKQNQATKTTRKESTKEYGSPSGAKSLGINIEASLPPSPLKAKEKNIIHEDIFPEPKDDSQKIIGNSIKEIKKRGDAKEIFAIIFRNGNEIKVYYTHTYFHEAKNEENKRLGLLSKELQAELIVDKDEAFVSVGALEAIHCFFS